jgi:protein-tyrosine-phosphatase
MITQNEDKNTILFVCTGNTCRSPMAEYYFNDEMKRLGLNFVAKSCGLHAETGCQMSANAKKILASQSIVEKIEDIIHKSKQIDEDIVKEAEFIYGITIHHQIRLTENFPEFKDKILSMPENIGDPYGGSLEVYEKCFENIKKSVDIIIKSLVEGK